MIKLCLVALLVGCVSPDAPTSDLLSPITATVVASSQIVQRWGESGWDAPSTVRLANVQAGDAIIVLGMYWISSSGSAKPSDTAGTLIAAVNQAPLYRNPPVDVQIYYELNAAPGVHTIKPPNLAFGGDGTLYVLQISGGLSSFVGAAHNHADGTALHSVSVAAPALAGDFVVAVGGEDDAVAFGPNAGMSGPPPGWFGIGMQQNADVNVPSAAYAATAAVGGTQSATWTWADTTANVTGAGIAAFR